MATDTGRVLSVNVGSVREGQIGRPLSYGEFGDHQLT